MKNIRNLIRLTLESLESSRVDATDKLTKWALNHGNDLEKGLALAGYPPIPRSGGNSFLGSGVYNSAYEVLYNGCRAVARLSMKQSELTTMQSFMSYKNNIPKNLRVHFPNVYQDVEITTPSGKKWYGVIMEFLVPVPESFKNTLSSVQGMNTHPMVSKQHELQILIDDSSKFNQNVVSKALQKFGSEIGINIAQRSGQQEDSKDVLDATENIVLFLWHTFKGTVAREINNYNYDISLEMILDYAEEDVESSVDIDVRQICAFFADVIDELFDYTIPVSKTHKNPEIVNSKIESHPSSQVKKLYNFLNFLARRGVDWEDLHTNNFMMRPSTEDLVVTDPGFFTIRKNNIN